MKLCHIKNIALLSALVTTTNVFSQNAPAKIVAGIPVNYQEDSVRSYTLPDVLTLQNGKKVTDKNTWNNQRRPQIVHLYEDIQFGKMPPRPADMTFNVFDKGT